MPIILLKLTYPLIFLYFYAKITLMQQEIRNNIKNLRKSLDSATANSLSNIIIKKVLGLKEIKQNDTFMVYNSLKTEVQTDRLITALKSQNKTVAYPITVGDDMVAGVPCGNDYKKSSLGVIEPLEYTILENPSVVIVPLVACDKNLNRIGMGKGYYDRYLSGKSAIKIGICYDFQVVDKIIPTKTDIPLDIIVTEKQILRS
jgi:5-formyltetrahydrofolate cyclo-ligase